MIKYTCDWCGKTIEVEEPGLPEGWRTIEYESPEDMQTVAQRIADAMPADADGR